MNAETLTMLASLAAIIGAMVAFSQLNTMKRNTQMDEGKRRQEAEQIKRDLDDAKARLAHLEAESRESQIDIAEIKTDVKHILKALSVIEEKLDRQKEC